MFQTKWLNFEPEAWFSYPTGALYYVQAKRGQRIMAKRDPVNGKVTVAPGPGTAGIVCEYKCV